MAKIDVYEIVRDRILAQLKEGTVPWRRPWSTSRPRNAVSKHEYRGINLFLLPRDYADNRWVTFKQALDLGGNVRKGEKSSMVVFWKMLEKEDESAPKGKKVIPILRYYNVFNVAQCEGLKLPAQTTPSGASEIVDAELIVANMPNRPEIQHAGEQACYSPTFDNITMPARETFSDSAGYYATLFHELTHSTGHASRLGRHANQQMTFGCEDYGKEELVAEFGSAYLCAMAGIDNATLTDQNAAYVASWIKAIKAADRQLLVSAASKAQKAATYITGDAEPVLEQEAA